jgi:hypothetical protein
VEYGQIYSEEPKTERPRKEKLLPPLSAPPEPPEQVRAVHHRSLQLQSPLGRSLARSSDLGVTGEHPSVGACTGLNAEDPVETTVHIEETNASVRSIAIFKPFKGTGTHDFLPRDSSCCDLCLAK